MKLGKLITSGVIASAIALTGVATQAHAQDYSGDNGKATYTWKDPNTDKKYKEYAPSKQAAVKTVKRDVKQEAKPVVKKTTYVDRYRGFPTLSYKEHGKWKTEVADSYKDKWEKAQRKGQTFTKTITFWYHGHKYTQTITFKK